MTLSCNDAVLLRCTALIAAGPFMPHALASNAKTEKAHPAAADSAARHVLLKNSDVNQLLSELKRKEPNICATIAHQLLSTADVKHG